MSLVHLDQRRLLAAPQCYADLELATLASPTLTGKHVFQINKPGMIQGVGGWFQAELTAGVVIDTSPGAPATHWQQAFFPFREAISVVKGDYLEFQLDVGPSPHALDNTEITYQYRCTQRGGTPGGERASVPLRR